MPKFTDECVSLKIRSGVANRVNELPSWEMVCPVQNFQKSELRRGRAAGEAVSSMVLDYKAPHDTPGGLAPWHTMDQGDVSDGTTGGIAGGAGAPRCSMF